MRGRRLLGALLLAAAVAAASATYVLGFAGNPHEQPVKCPAIRFNHHPELSEDHRQVYVVDGVEGGPYNLSELWFAFDEGTRYYNADGIGWAVAGGPYPFTEVYEPVQFNRTGVVYQDRAAPADELDVGDRMVLNSTYPVEFLVFDGPYRWSDVIGGNWGCGEPAGLDTVEDGPEENRPS